MNKQAQVSNRAQRRAAERAALKAIRKDERQAMFVAATKVFTAQVTAPLPSNTAVGDPLSSLLIPFDIHPTEAPMQSTSPSETPKFPGPRTEAGKEISSRNAIRHGACATNTLLLTSESKADYDQLESAWFQTYQVNPNQQTIDPIKSELIRTAVRADWFFKRSERHYSDVEFQLISENQNMSEWTDEQHKKLARALRYRTANANLLSKHRKELEAHIKARASEAAFHQNTGHKDEKMAMARERLEIFRQKNKPFDLAEELAAMKEKAIRLGFRQPDPTPDTGD